MSLYALDSTIASGPRITDAHLLARSPTALRLLREVLGLFAAEFEADEEVPGADLVDRFAEWRGRALAELSAPIQPVEG